MALLAGMTVLITGGARGQGRAHALRSAREGADIILVDCAEQIASVPYAMGNEADLAETVRQVEALGRNALAIKADVRSQEDMDAAVRAGITKFGKIDILIANAGIWEWGPFWELSERAWEDVVGVCLTGVWKTTKAVTPHMIGRQQGSIVMISSVGGYEPSPNSAHYSAAKHGVIGLMKSVALELAPHNIRCNAICPSATLTEMIDHQAVWDMMAGRTGATQSDMRQAGLHLHALKGQSVLPPEAIANTALYLNSSLAASVTGVSIPVDAGHSVLGGFNFTPTE